MEKYTIIDYNGNPVKFMSDNMNGYTLINVSEYLCYQLPYKEAARSELENINRVINNDNYYDVHICESVKFPLRLAIVELEVKISELLE